MTVMLPSYVVWPLPTQMDPLDPSERLLLPELRVACLDFEKFYCSKWIKRKLSWLHHLARVTMTYHAGSREYELIVTVPQANLLARFVDREEIAVPELLSAMKITRSELQSIVKPIIGVGILRWNVLESGEATILQLATGWESKRSRLRLCHHSLGSSIDADEGLADVSSEGSEPTPDLLPMEAEESSQGLAESKKYFLQAIIVKLLKMHQELSPARLFQLVLEAASHPGPHCCSPTDAHISTVVSQLAEKQYLEYDVRRDLYVYMP